MKTYLLLASACLLQLWWSLDDDKGRSTNTLIPQPWVAFRRIKHCLTNYAKRSCKEITEIMKTERVRAHQETQAMIQIAQRHLPPIHNCFRHHIRRGWCQALLAMQANARRDIHPSCLDTNSLSDDEGLAGNEEVLGRDERAQSGTDDYLHIVELSPLGSQLTERKRAQSGTEYHHYFGLSPLESQSIRAQRETNGNKVGPSPLGSNQQTTRARSGTNICSVGLSPLESSYSTTEPKGDSTRIIDEQPAENPDQLPQ